MALKLLVLSSTFPRFIGDAEPPFVFELCRRLAVQHEVTVLVPHAPGLPEQEHMAGLDVRRFRYAPSSWQQLAYQGGILPKLKQNRWYYLLLPGFILGQAWALWRLLKQQKFDVIHAHWLIPQGLIAAILAGDTPVVVTSHGGDLYGLRGPVLQRLKAWIVRRSVCLTVVSHAMAQQVSSWCDVRKVRVISMGVDLQATFTPDNSIVREPAQLLFVGRLVQKKGLKYLLEAMALTVEHWPELTLKVIGDGPERAELEALSKRLNIDKRIQWLGKVPNGSLPQHYRQATAFVMPSIIDERGDQEGLGLVAVEAMGCGCPVIASDLPALRDVVLDKETGFRVKPADSQALAQLLKFLSINTSLLNKLTEQARCYALEKFDWQIINQKYEKIMVKGFEDE